MPRPCRRQCLPIQARSQALAGLLVLALGASAGCAAGPRAQGEAAARRSVDREPPADARELSQPLPGPVSGPLWILVAPEQRAAEPERPRTLAAPRLFAQRSASAPEPLSLLSLQTHAAVQDFVARMRLQQRWRYRGEAAELLLAFRLPPSAAVHGFVLAVGGRRLRAIVRPREEALALAQAAAAAGYETSLLTEVLPGTYLQRIDRLEGPEEVGLELTWDHAVPVQGGRYHLRLPGIEEGESGATYEATVHLAAAGGVQGLDGMPGRVRREGNGVWLEVDEAPPPGHPWVLSWQAPPGARWLWGPTGTQTWAVLLPPGASVPADMEAPAEVHGVRAGERRIVLGRGAAPAVLRKAPELRDVRRHPAVETLWARAQVRALLHAAAAAADPTPLLRAAGSIGLQHGLAGAENAALTVDTAP